MISDNAFNIAQAVAKNIDVQLQPVDGTVLADLVRANISSHTYASAATPDTIMDIGVIVDDSKREELDGTPIHTAVMEEQVKVAAEIVRANILLAKDHVIPATKQVHEYYDALLADRAVDSHNPVSLVSKHWADVWGNSHLTGLTARFENVAFQTYVVPTGLPELTQPELREMIKSGIEGLDEDIDLWCKDANDTFLVDAYNKMFRSGLEIGRGVGPTHVVPNTNITADDILLAHLVSMNFEEQLPDNTSMDLQKLRVVMSTVRRVTGHAINRCFEMRERSIRYKTLAYDVRQVDYEYHNSGRPVALLNHDVYHRFLEEGGTPEVIMGAVLANAPIEYDKLIEESDKYTRTFHTRMSILKQETAARVLAAHRESLLFALTRYVNECDEESLETPRDEMHACIKHNVSELSKSSDFADSWKLIRCMVSEIMYSHTNVAMFLDAWDEAEENDSDLTPQECALQATIDFVGRWLSAQIQPQE